MVLHCSRDDDDDDDDDNNNAVGDGADDGEGSHGEDDDGKGGKLTSMCRTTLPTVMPMPLVMIRHGASLVYDDDSGDIHLVKKNWCVWQAVTTTLEAQSLPFGWPLHGVSYRCTCCSAY